jgi:putative DNA primase/helicase
VAEDKKVVEFRPPSIESEGAAEHASRLRALVEQRAGQPAFERELYLEDDAKKHGITPTKFKAMVNAVVKENEKKAREAKAEDRQREQRVEKQQQTERWEQQRAVARLQRDQQREQQRADREARERQRERDRELVAISRLPRAEHEPRLAALAERLGEDLEVLRVQFAQFVSVEETGSDPGFAEVALWPEPVPTAALLSEVMAQIRRYNVLHDNDAAVATTLYVPFAWVHNEVAVYSPMLAITSAEADSGKTTLAGTLRHLTPKARGAAELTASSLFRFVDFYHPTLIIDDADKLFARKPDLVHIVNVGWTRDEAMIPRTGPKGIVHWYSVFCVKIIAGVNLRMAKETKTRCIFIKMLEKLQHEKVDAFKHIDDENFLTLRRKLARWAADNAAALKDARPAMPSLNNRTAMNWKLLLAIAELAGGDWPKLARQAAAKLTRVRREPSEGKRLLAAFWDLFAKHGPELSSADVQRCLTADPTSEWADFRGHGEITQRQISVLLDTYEIHPD